MDEAVRGVEDQRHGAAPVGHGEGARGDALLVGPLDLGLDARAVLARARTVAGQRVDQQVEQLRIVVELASR